MKELSRIKTILGQHMTELRQNYNVKELGVFGSVVHGDETSESDVDILIALSEPISLFTFMRLKHHLQDLLGREVDLVLKDGLKSFMKEDILSETQYVEA